MKYFLLITTMTAGLLAGNMPAPEGYSPTDIKVMGTLNSGQTSPVVEYGKPGQYRAFVFEGNGHDQVNITVSGGDGRAFVALADSTLMPIASGIGHLSVTLPYHGPDVEAFYILLKPTTNRPARLAVRLEKLPTAQGVSATR